MKLVFNKNKELFKNLEKRSFLCETLKIIYKKACFLIVQSTSVILFRKLTKHIKKNNIIS